MGGVGRQDRAAHGPGSRGSTPRARAAIGLGSNLGDRHAHLRWAAGRLGEILSDLVVSPFVETDPVGVGPQPRYLNAAAVGYTAIGPRALLSCLLDLERERGRSRPWPGAPRTLDLDLILYGGLVMNEPELVLPHPRFRERAFVLEPLAAVAPDLVDPVSGLSVAELWSGLGRARRYGLS
jgi:2-amino-4-hydroxy-6-hydroxymethyldihydropteridine diphosphokinase